DKIHDSIKSFQRTPAIVTSQLQRTGQYTCLAFSVNSRLESRRHGIFRRGTIIRNENRSSSKLATRFSSLLGISRLPDQAKSLTTSNTDHLEFLLSLADKPISLTSHLPSVGYTQSFTSPFWKSAMRTLLQAEPLSRHPH